MAIIPRVRLPRSWEWVSIPFITGGKREWYLLFERLHMALGGIQSPLKSYKRYDKKFVVFHSSKNE
jgi:hypothetical protein